MPVSCGLRRWAAMPEPTTAISSNAVPMNSAVARRRSPTPGYALVPQVPGPQTGMVRRPLGGTSEFASTV